MTEDVDTLRTDLKHARKEADVLLGMILALAANREDSEEHIGHIRQILASHEHASDGWYVGSGGGE